jgi:hypothetical protein
MSVASSSSANRLDTIKFFQQIAQLLHVLFREFPMLTEMGDQRRNATAKQPIEKSGTFLKEPLIARENRSVEISTSLLAGVNRPLFQKAVEQGFYG